MSSSFQDASMIRKIENKGLTFPGSFPRTPLELIEWFIFANLAFPPDLLVFLIV